MEGTRRWIALLGAAGCLVPLVLWLVRDRLGARARVALTALGATLLVGEVTDAMSRSVWIGYFLEPGEAVSTAHEARAVALGVAGVVLGLAVVFVTWPGHETGGGTGEGTGGETGGDEAADRTTLLLLAVALGLPLLSFAPIGAFTELFVLVDPGATTMAVFFAEGLTLGLALLLPALAVGRRGARWVLAAYLVTVAGRTAAAAFPDWFTSELWYMTGAGLACGLVVPPALRALRTVRLDDRVAVGAGVALAVALLAGQTAIPVETEFDADRFGGRTQAP